MRLLKFGTYVEELRLVLAFLARPSLEVDEQPLWRHLTAFFALIIASLVLAILAGIVSQIIVALSDTPPLENFLETQEFAPWQLILMAVIMAPLLEETAYRAPLRPTPLMMALFAAVWTIILPNIIFAGSFAAMTPDKAAGFFAVQLAAALAFGSLVFVWLQNAATRARLEGFVTKWFALIFWLSIVAFGLSHVSNYGGIVFAEHWFLFPVLALPQLVIGTILGVMRMRFGFLAVIYAHALYNGTLLLALG